MTIFIHYPYGYCYSEEELVEFAKVWASTVVNEFLNRNPNKPFTAPDIDAKLCEFTDVRYALQKQMAAAERENECPPVPLTTPTISSSGSPTEKSSPCPNGDTEST